MPTIKLWTYFNGVYKNTLFYYHFSVLMIYHEPWFWNQAPKWSPRPKPSNTNTLQLMELVEIELRQKRGHFEKLFRLTICASLFWRKIQVSYKFEQKQSRKFWHVSTQQQQQLSLNSKIFNYCRRCTLGTILSSSIYFKQHRHPDLC